MNQQQYEGYDLIGDVHGCGGTLIRLLEIMGYQKKAGVYQHPKRQVIFVGDIVDRGPHIRQALGVVYDMVTHNHAQIVMGNHEYNVYCFAVPDNRENNNEYLRAHSPHHTRFVAETFEQFANYPDELKQYIEWFGQLPLYIENDHFRVVHACWDDAYVKAYQARFNTNCVSPEIIETSTDLNSFEGRVLDRLMRGTSLKLPDDQIIKSRDGLERRFFRTKFWASSPKTYGDVVFQPDPLPETLNHRELSKKERSKILDYPANAKPIFFGHYWLQGKPMPVRPNICCLDYSAVKYGRLVAYRYDKADKGKALDSDNFVWLYVDPTSDEDSQRI
ncbi:MAG: hypothetical protein ACI80S_000133 [Pseudohongiellaceae bacterium]